MSKAFYEVIGDKIFRLDTSILNSPVAVAEMVSRTETHTQMAVVGSNVTAEIHVDASGDAELMSNEEALEKMLQIIAEKKITEIKTVNPSYFYIIDYSIYSGTEGEVQHSMAFGVFKNFFKICPLGINAQNHLCYKVVSSLQQGMTLSSESKAMSWGITETVTKRTKYRVVINDISIFLDTTEYEGTDRQLAVTNFLSGHSASIRHGADTTILSLINSMTKVWSSADKGLTIMPIDTAFKPNGVKLAFDILLDDIVVVYDDMETVENALLGN